MSFFLKNGPLHPPRHNKQAGDSSLERLLDHGEAVEGWEMGGAGGPVYLAAPSIIFMYYQRW